MQALDFLNSRRSLPARQLGEPGPDEQQLELLLSAARRVPDHGKLVPFRLLLIRGEARVSLGERLAAIHRLKDPDISESALTKDRERYTFAPLVVAVIARIQADDPKVPEQEQLLCAGLVAHNLLLGAHALGFAAQWLTGWAAYDRDAAALLQLGAQERVVAFIHIGTAREVAPERLRPDLADVVAEWQP